MTPTTITAPPTIAADSAASKKRVQAIVDQVDQQLTQSTTQVSDLKIASRNDTLGADKTKASDAPNAAPTATDTATTTDTRKLIRNAQLELEVKSFQAAMDEITAQTKAAGGYVDTSNSQKGGNGKLQGTVVVKVLPQNLDDFLLKLRDLGEVQNLSLIHI